MVTPPPKSLHYDGMIMWYIDNPCNLQCPYCATEIASLSIEKLSQESPLGRLLGLFRSLFSHRRTDTIKRMLPVTVIDTVRLAPALDRMDKVFLFRLTGGGEPFLLSNILEVSKIITKKHLLRINTNLTPPSVAKFAEEIDPQRVERISASCHWDELHRKRLFEKFVANYERLISKGFRIEVKLVAHPGQLSRISEIRKTLSERGIPLRFKLFYGHYEGRFYPSSYTADQLKELDQTSEDADAVFPRGRVCPAGFNVGVIRSNSGDVQVCDILKQNIGNIYDGLKFFKTAAACPVETCFCPFFHYEPKLAQLARNSRTVPAKGSNEAA